MRRIIERLLSENGLQAGMFPITLAGYSGKTEWFASARPVWDSIATLSGWEYGYGEFGVPEGMPQNIVGTDGGPVLGGNDLAHTEEYFDGRFNHTVHLRIQKNAFGCAELDRLPFASNAIESAVAQISFAPGSFSYYTASETYSVVKKTGAEVPAGAMYEIVDDYWYCCNNTLFTEETEGNVTLGLMAIVYEDDRFVPRLIAATGTSFHVTADGSSQKIDALEFVKAYRSWLGGCVAFQWIVIPTLQDFVVDPDAWGTHEALKNLLAATLIFPSSVWERTVGGVVYRASEGNRISASIHYSAPTIGSIYIKFNSNISLDGIMPVYSIPPARI